MAAYLFVHFIGEQKDGEQIYFSVSRDGLHWEDLNDGKPILCSRTGMRGVRIHTRCAAPGRQNLPHRHRPAHRGRTWLGGCPVQGEPGFDCLGVGGFGALERGEGLPGRPAGGGLRVGPGGRVRPGEREFLVFFASMVKAVSEERSKQRIYAAYTKDFRTFSDTFLYMERDDHVIDTTILENGGRYYRVSKDEVTKRLILEQADSLLGEFAQIDSPVLRNLVGVEGPEGYRLPDGSWCLIADWFLEGKGYLPMVTENLDSGEFRILSRSSTTWGIRKSATAAS